MGQIKIHGNSLENDKPHHLYEIHDKAEGELLKYGISHDPIDEDGLSQRIKIQLKLLNLGANWIRYFARIILKNIPGRRKAKEIERQHILDYEKENGQKPRGNLD